MTTAHEITLADFSRVRAALRRAPGPIAPDVVRASVYLEDGRRISTRRVEAMIQSFVRVGAVRDDGNGKYFSPS